MNTISKTVTVSVQMGIEWWDLGDRISNRIYSDLNPVVKTGSEKKHKRSGEQTAQDVFENFTNLITYFIPKV